MPKAVRLSANKHTWCSQNKGPVAATKISACQICTRAPLLTIDETCKDIQDILKAADCHWPHKWAPLVPPAAYCSTAFSNQGGRLPAADVKQAEPMWVIKCKQGPLCVHVSQNQTDRQHCLQMQLVPTTRLNRILLLHTAEAGNNKQSINTNLSSQSS